MLLSRPPSISIPAGDMEIAGLAPGPCPSCLIASSVVLPLAGRLAPQANSNSRMKAPLIAIGNSEVNGAPLATDSARRNSFSVRISLLIDAAPLILVLSISATDVTAVVERRFRAGRRPRWRFPLWQ